MTYLAKVGELSLKGSNIDEFKNRLASNARRLLKNASAKVSGNAGRLYIDCDDEEASRFALEHLIGITGWAKATVVEKDIDAISRAVYEEAVRAKEKGAKSFKIEARRQDKDFPLTSYEICCKAADRASREGVLAVDVHSPDVRIYVEVRDRCFVFSDAEKGRRGLPVGSSGKGLLLLSGGIDSPVAGYRMMRRGMKIDCAYFHSYPYTSEEAQKKVESLAASLANYGLDTYLNIVPFTDVQMRIKEKAPQAWTTLMLRVCMMKTANLIAERTHADCIVTGESLGQVASQTIANLNVTEHFASRPLLRPLVGLDKEEIIDTAREIGTYETSILPYEDCCVLFSPKHPVLRASTEEAEAIYASLDADALIQEAFEKREIKRFSV
ncbi:MAG: tRNA uracil 4-sulfurtransferase ThiI [Treponema socranskii subsp. buccale]